jgi:hypothetical protein
MRAARALLGWSRDADRPQVVFRAFPARASVHLDWRLVRSGDVDLLSRVGPSGMTHPVPLLNPRFGGLLWTICG